MLIEIEKHNRFCMLRCNGRLVAGPGMEYMLTKMDDIRRMECTTVLADFQDVACIGSMGVAFIVGAYTSVTRRPNGRFVLAGANPLVQRVLELTGLNNVIPQAADLTTGLALLGAEALMGALVIGAVALAH